MKKTALLISVVVASVLLSACAPKYSSTGSSASPEMLYMESAVEAPQAAYEEEYRDVADDSMSNSGKSEQIVIKNASMSISLRDVEAGIQAISAFADTYGGFLVYSNVYKYTGSDGMEYSSGTITIRVDADKLEVAMEAIRSLVEERETDIDSENISGQDVTSTVYDREARLANYRNAEEKLNQLLDEATTTEDALAVFSELTYIQEQIEVLEGEIKYYRDSARLSSIDISISQKVDIKPITSKGWQPLETLRDAGQALVSALQWIADVLIFFTIFCAPFLLVFVALPLWLTWLSLKKKGWTRKGLRWIKPKPVPPPFEEKS